MPRRATPYIYPYAPNGTFQGYQVRFKRCLGRRPQTTSRYFSVASCGSVTKALRKAEAWRRRNLRWMRDPQFKVAKAA